MITIALNEGVVRSIVTEVANICKGQIWFAELEGRGSVQKNIRPVLVFQNDMASRFSPVLTVIPVDSIALCEQIQTIDKSQLKEYTGIILDKDYLTKIKNGIFVQLGIV